MKKFLVILALLILTLGASAYLFFKPQAQEDFLSSEDVGANLTLLPCDMNEQHSCGVEFRGKTVKFSLSPKPVYTMQPTLVRIEGLEGFKNPSLEIRGINMDMGVIKADVEKRDNAYISNIVLSACLINIMRYRFEVLENGKRSGLYIDFDLHQ